MLKRARFWILAAALVVVVLATTSYTPSVTLQVQDEHGTAASDAFAAYRYDGSLLNPVHPVTYVVREPAIARADAAGRIVIPRRVHFRRPLPPSMPPKLFIAYLYVPRLHNAFGPVAQGPMSHPGVFVIDENGERVTVFDVSHSPEAWEASLRHLFEMIRIVFETPAGRAAARELITQLRREYAALLARYGDTLREPPDVTPAHLATEQDRREWREQLDAALAREPRWGPFLERTWRSSLTALDRWEASLSR